MRVCFYLADQNPQRDRSRGITEYTDGLLRALAKQGELELSCLASRSSYRPVVAGPELRMLPLRSDRLPGRLAVDQLHPLAARARADLWHYPKGFLSLLARPRVPVVGTLHDAIPEFYAQRYPRTRSRAEFAYWRLVLARSIARLDRILTVSEFSKRALLEFCERQRIQPPPIDVTYEGARFEDVEPDVYAKRDGVLHLCSPLPHKRTETLLEFFCALQGEMQLPLLRLVGNLTPRQEWWAAKLRHVERLPSLAPQALARELTQAQALLLPSEIEGFGLPALEAYYLGTPVVYVRGTAVEEVLGGGTPGGFDLVSPESFRSALEEALALEPAQRKATGGRLRARFAWSACARRTLRAYRELA